MADTHQIIIRKIYVHVTTVCRGIHDVAQPQPASRYDLFVKTTAGANVLPALSVIMLSSPVHTRYLAMTCVTKLAKAGMLRRSKPMACASSNVRSAVHPFCLARLSASSSAARAPVAQCNR